MSQSKVPTFFWDSCVFYAFLNSPAAPLSNDVAQYISEAQNGKARILCSTLAFSEVRPSQLKKKGYETIDDFFDDLNGVVLPIDPNPTIMKNAGILKDHRYSHAVKQPRNIATPDAIQLLTCLFAIEELGETNVVFHTFDDGGGKGWEGKCVPLLSFEDWIAGCDHIPLVGKIAAMPRKKPEYPQPQLSLGGA